MIYLIQIRFDTQGKLTCALSLSLCHINSISIRSQIKSLSQAEYQKTRNKLSKVLAYIFRTITKRHVYYLLSSAILFTKRYPHKTVDVYYMSTICLYIPHAPNKH